jgi:hypothetical protein
MEARVFLYPGCDAGMLMSGVIVDDEMEIKPRRALTIYPAQEFEELLASLGELCRVVSTIRRLCSAFSRRELGLRGSSCSMPATPARAKCSRQRITVGREMLSSRAI